MEKYVCHNGQFIAADTPLFTTNNRSFKYGDGLFETMIMLNGNVPFLAQHYERLTSSMQYLHLNIPTIWNLDYWRGYIKTLSRLHEQAPNARLRLNVYRQAGGHYTPNNNAVDWLLSFNAMKSNCFLLNKKGLHIDLYPDLQKPISYISHLKSNNALLYTLAGLYAQQHQLDECILLNTKGKIAEAISANICVVKRNCLFIPPISDGGVSGIMLAQIKRYAEALFIPVISSSISPASLHNASEIWLTNAIKGIQWVGSFKNNRYSNRLAQKFVAKLNEEIFTHHL